MPPAPARGNEEGPLPQRRAAHSDWAGVAKPAGPTVSLWVSSPHTKAGSAPAAVHRSPGAPYPVS